MSIVNDSRTECNAERIGEQNIQGANDSRSNNPHEAVDSSRNQQATSIAGQPPITENGRQRVSKKVTEDPGWRPARS